MTAQAFHLPAQWSTRPVNVALIGCGGTGSHFADGLASLEVTLRALGHPGFVVSLWDGDAVSLANCGRQRFCRADVGMSKAELLCHRIGLFYGLRWTPHARHHDADPREVQKHDLIVTATDSAAFRARLAEVAERRGRWAAQDTLFLDHGNSAREGNVVLGHLGAATRGIRLPNVVDLHPELRDPAFQKSSASEPSCSVEAAIASQEWPVNRQAAQLGLDLLWQLFRHGRIEHHGARFSVSPARVDLMPIDPAIWAMHGYVAEAPAKAA